MISLKLNVVKLQDIASGKVSASEALANIISLKPQLAFDPKLGNAEELYSYAKEQWRFYDSEKPYWAEEKVDGVRCQFVLGLANDKPFAKAYSRANRELASVGHLTEDLLTSRDSFIESNKDEADELMLAKWLADRKRQGYDLLVINCELFALETTSEGSETSTYVPFRLVNGFANRQQADDDTRRLRAYVFQCYWANSRGSCICTVEPSYWQLLLYSQLRLQKTRWVAANRYQIESANDLVSIANYLASQHCEGLVLKSPDFRHFDGRTKNWLKLKFRRSGTFRLVEVIAGEGKCLGNAGAIRICDASGAATLVGTGFSDEDRAELSSLDLDAEPIFVEVSYMTTTGNSLREASFEGIRRDLPADYIATDLFTAR